MGADNRIWSCWHDDPDDVLMFSFIYGNQETPAQAAEAYAATFTPAPTEVFCRLEAGRVHRVLRQGDMQQPETDATTGGKR